MTWADITSLKPGQACFPRMDCHGADRSKEDVPANEPCPVDLVSLFSAWAHNLQIQEGPPAVKVYLLYPKDVEPLGWKSSEKPHGLHCLLWGSHLQPPSLGSPHLWMKAPSPDGWCKNRDVSRGWGKEGRRNGTQALGVSSGTFLSNYQSRNRTFPKALVPPGTRVGHKDMLPSCGYFA